jgi:1,4-alpha-glucan branching enzyme
VEGGTIVRAWRPGAETVRVLVDDELAAKLEMVHEAGLFEGIVEDPLEDYELEVGYADGQTFEQKDPYAFLPTLGELDLHLAGEGRHAWDAAVHPSC